MSRGWIGIPFVDGGRDWRTGLDCYGLVRAYLLEERGLELPLYSETPAADVAAAEAAVRAGIATGLWAEVERDRLERFDVVLMYGFERRGESNVRTLRHMGVMLGPHWLLHIEAGTDSVMVRLTDGVVRDRLHSFWRYNGKN